MDKKIDKEAKSQEQRLNWAIFLSVILHILLIILISNLKNDVPKENSKVITVRLADNINVSQEKSGSNKNTPVKKESAPPKKDAVQKDTDKTPPEQKPTAHKSVNKENSKNIEKTKQPEIPHEKIIEKQNNSSISEENKPIENAPITTEEDIFDKIETSQKEAKQQLEENFFENSQSGKEILPDFDFTDALLANDSALDKKNDSNGSGENNDRDKNDNDSDNGKDIEWNSGGSRKLLRGGEIEVLDEVKKAGLKFQIEIDFDVDPDGYIRNATIIKSSGNPFWDENIREQFRQWFFEKTSKQENSSGKIIIIVDY